LSLTRDGLTKLQQKDPSFPRPIKFSKERQAHAYFDIKELQEWLELKKSEREEY
jgi:prophage regulatory protein